ncbi:MAG: GH116 family glycosyl-hydrolase, partial [Phycisphaerae bacterium]
VDYRNAAVPVRVSLEAFSPFIPLQAAESGLPATVFNFTLTNTSATPVEATLAGGLQNGACQYHRFGVAGNRRNRITSGPEWTVLHCTAESGPADTDTAPKRPEIIFDDWKQATFAGWTVQGTSFGPGPIERAVIEKKMGQLGGQSPRLVNSYVPGETNAGTGKLTSKPFTIERRYINIWIGGGDIEGKTCVNLVIDGKIVQSQTGAQENRLSLHFFDVRALAGKQATLEIVDDSEAHWGQIGVGRITFSDVAGNNIPLEQLPDYGSMALALLGGPAQVACAKSTIGFEGETAADAAVPLGQILVGTLGRTVRLEPGASAVITFLVAWHFPNLAMDKIGKVGRYYTQRFDSAQAVARYVAGNFSKLAAATRLWRDTWYDSTLPYWFLDRTLINVSTLATGGCYRFADGRFYAYESGSGCCAGTCTHVWQYAQSMSRIFPELERDTRERVDLGIALHADTGVSGFRGEYDMNLAVDGQAGTILRIYREHQMAPDEAFLKRNWGNIKKMYQPLFALDADEDGLLEGAQMNTL